MRVPIRNSGRGRERGTANERAVAIEHGDLERDRRIGDHARRRVPSRARHPVAEGNALRGRGAEGFSGRVRRDDAPC